jgi:hypothetical protein
MPVLRNWEPSNAAAKLADGFDRAVDAALRNLAAR